MKCNRILSKGFDDLTEREKKELTQRLALQMKEEFIHRDRGGIYGLTSREMAYNSNRIEGSRLSSEETVSLFETGQILSNGEVVYHSKDIEEMTGHFLMFNTMLQHLDESLSVALIKLFHYELECGVFEFRANGYLAGEFKTRSNTVGNITTSSPQDVARDMGQLMVRYRTTKSVTLEELALFHADFEKIHPFQDGNGRVGRILLYRECLTHGILPFLVQDNTKVMYYRALKTAQMEQSVAPLVQYFESCQKLYYETLQEYLYDYRFDIEQDEEPSR